MSAGENMDSLDQNPTNERKSGKCLCGGVQVHARLTSQIQICHCSQCRTWTGGPGYYVVEVADLDLSGAQNIAHFSASEWGERGFCATCGTNIYWRMRGGDITSLSLGLFQDQSGLKISKEIFVDCRAPWSKSFEGATQSTEAQELEALNAYMSQQET